MRFLVAVVLIMLLAFIAGLVLPWWSIAFASFITLLMIEQSPLKSFLAGFLGLFILWGILALWIDMKNHSILSKKIAMILPLNGSSFLLILITAFVGALVAGFAGLTAGFLRAAR
ncbi:MAG: hypothetical protein QM764_03630 [Chitinophagaceae bacterium]